MEIYYKFQHFISYFLPGTIMFFVILADVSLLINKNLVEIFYNSSNFVYVTIIVATIFGLLLDAFRHAFIDESIEKHWSSAEKELEADELLYKNANLYRQIEGDYFYYYEFSFNLLMVILLATVSFICYSMCSGFTLSLPFIIFISSLTFIIIVVLFLFAKETYKDFITISSNLLIKENK